MIIVNEQYCPQNHRCPAVAYCPEGALIQESVTSAPRIDQELCTECGACVGICRTFSHSPAPALAR